MRLQEQLAESGQWVFRWRGVLPVVLIAVLLASLGHFTYPRGSHRLDVLWETLCIAVSGVGLAIRILVGGYVPKGTSGRNRRKQAADTLNTKGMYSIVGHPLYLGNFLISLGVSLMPRIWWVSAIYMLAYALYIERIMMAEERFLTGKFGQTYLDWANKTPAILPVGIRWGQPELPFSFKTALRREYRTLAGMVLAMFAMETIGDCYLLKRIVVDPLWLAILGCTLLLCALVRILDKTTRLLEVEGR